MRRVLGILRDTEEEASRESMPHLDALDHLVETVRHTGLDIRYRTRGPIQELPEALQLSTYRIVQEALTNVMKHAVGARLVTIDVVVTDAALTITVRDDGSPTGVLGSGHGLVGMRERAALHGGVVNAGPTVQGWSVEAQIRIDSRANGSEPS